MRRPPLLPPTNCSKKDPGVPCVPSIMNEKLLADDMNTSAPYRILDRSSVIDYVRSIPAVFAALGQANSLIVEEIGNGNLNYVYRIRSEEDPSLSVILKQAVPYFRLAGEGWPLSRDRMTFEIRALTLYNEIVPDFVPRIYHADEQMSTLVMQCLDDHIVLRQGMIAGNHYPNISQHIGIFLAETLFKTSVLGMASADRRQLMHQFALNAELCKLTEDFIFTFPYMEHESNYSNPQTDEWARQNLRNDSAYKLGILKYKNLFLTKADALLHADLHTGSLMANERETYVIDMEFAFFGPLGFDVGKIIANFLMCATSHLHRSSNRDYTNELLKQGLDVWRHFAERFLLLWDATSTSAMVIPGLLDDTELAAFKKSFMSDLLSESVGFAACVLARRTLGIAGVEDIRGIPDLDIRSKLEILNLELSQILMTESERISSIEELSSLIHKFFDKQPLA